MTMTQTEMAEALGLSQSAVSAGVRRGMPLTTPEAAEEWRAAHMQRRRNGGNINAKRAAIAAAARPDTGSAQARIIQARARREEAEALFAERRAAEQAGALVLVADVEAAAARCFSEIRMAFMSMGDRLGPQMPALDGRQAARVIDNEVRRILEALTREDVVPARRPRHEPADTPEAGLDHRADDGGRNPPAESRAS